jgi:uncharacterized beta-barrel protein YwiB (DUF1934 family)
MKAYLELHSHHYADGRHEEEVIKTDCEYLEHGSTRYITYDSDTDDGEKVKNILKIKEAEFTYSKKTTTTSTMFFRPGVVTKSSYITPYGTFAMAMDTKEYGVIETEDGLKLNLKYDLSLEGQHQSNCHIFLRLVLNNDTIDQA